VSASFTPSGLASFGYEALEHVTDDPKRGIALIDFGLALPIKFTKVAPRQAVNGAYAFIGSHVWKLERESARDDLEAVGLTMAWMLLGGRLPWTGDEPKTIGKKIQDPHLPQRLGEVCDNALIAEFLLRVRNLGVDDDPGYDELLFLLETESGSFMDSLDWPESKSCNSSGESPTRRAEGVSSNSAIKRAITVSERLKAR